MTHDARFWRKQLECSVAKVDDIFEDCLSEALGVMSPGAVEDWLKGASQICGLGRGTELVLIFLEEIPAIVSLTDESVILDIADLAYFLSRNACGKAINPYLSTLTAVTRRLDSPDLLRDWLKLVRHMALKAPEGLEPLLGKAVFLLGQLSIGGLRNWVENGIHAYAGQRHRMGDFFALQSADSHAMLQRERHGTLLVDHERQLTMWLKALWGLEKDFQPYSLAFDELRKPVPHLDRLGFHIPDVYDDLDKITGLERYYAVLAHLSAHALWSEPMLADNFSPFQHLAIEVFEDARIEHLAMARYPGLGTLWRALHPVPEEGACPSGYSCIRHQLAMLSRALLDPEHNYTDQVVHDYTARFHERFAQNPHDKKLAIELGVKWLAQNYTHDFRQPKIWFENTQIPYRDDNRYLWLFLEDTDDEDDFHSDHGATDKTHDSQSSDGLLPPQHYPEWDYASASYRPDWATVYENIQPPGNAAFIDDLLAKHRQLARQLKKIIDQLKPQQRRRVRYQEDGDELDLEVLIRAWTEYKARSTPDTRIMQSHVRDGRNIAVLLLLDLSQSISDTPKGASSSILQLSQEAVSLLGWAVDALGDPFAIAGFASNTRHEVRYSHFKGFAESWGHDPKARLAGIEAGYSTRMGAALRHAGRYLEQRREEKKLLLLLTDGEPHDIDVSDGAYLHHDTHAAVGELDSKGISTFCITLDAKADDYV
ncbi:MAG TPA: VWA domain-containing protein, partial [Rhizobiales bacterium]|nr:VWA domain-containing protein [Hyphomicrobiales bacterium]